MPLRNVALVPFVRALKVSGVSRRRGRGRINRAGSPVFRIEVMQPRNHELAVVLKNDPHRLRIRAVGAKKGRGRKSRPRTSNRARRERESA